MSGNKHTLLVKEIDIIRNELSQLKACQLSYVLAGVSSSGAAAAYLFGSEVAEKLNDVPAILFLPGAISLPFWCTYFDKAVTVTRIVGYCRVIERILLHEMDGTKAYPKTFKSNKPLEYKGWENAVREYRDSGKYPIKIKKHIPMKKDIPQNAIFLVPINAHLHGFRIRSRWRLWTNRVRKFCSLLWTRAEYNYWVFSWITFMMICLTSVVGATIAKGSNYGYYDMLIIAPIVISMAASIRYNTVTLYRLVFGKYSYGNREKVWEQVLSSQADAVITPAQSTGEAPR